VSVTERAGVGGDAHSAAVAGRLTGRVAVVTGGGAPGPEMNIGRAVSLLLSRAGVHLVVVDVDPVAAERTAEEIRAQGGDAVTAVGDVTDESACTRAVAAALGRWDRLDILVNNVGIGGGGAVDGLPLDAWRRVMDVNATGAFLMTKAAVPALCVGGGAVVNISSAAVGQPGNATAYAASKAAVEALTRATAAQYGPSGVRANCVSPGMVWSDMVARAARSADEAITLRERRRLLSLLETEGTPWDVAHAVLFLAGPESRWITGQVLRVDGGAPIRKH
jgi:NAD(P)-dependent dehydrogenase (short-subunit alcohol dehydrogenase family)